MHTTLAIYVPHAYGPPGIRGPEGWTTLRGVVSNGLALILPIFFRASAKIPVLGNFTIPALMIFRTAQCIFFLPSIRPGGCCTQHSQRVDVITERGSTESSNFTQYKFAPRPASPRWPFGSELDQFKAACTFKRHPFHYGAETCSEIACR